MGAESSGVAGVYLWYSRDGAGWMRYGDLHPAGRPIPFDISSLGGKGRYALYTVAVDIAGNQQSALGAAQIRFSVGILPAEFWRIF